MELKHTNPNGQFVVVNNLHPLDFKNWVQKLNLYINFDLIAWKLNVFITFTLPIQMKWMKAIHV